jgi:hypothetical protein
MFLHQAMSATPTRPTKKEGYVAFLSASRICTRNAHLFRSSDSCTSVIVFAW